MPTFDAATGDTDLVSDTAHSFSHTCTGSNLILWVAIMLDNDVTNLAGTYDGDAMTLLDQHDTGNGSLGVLYKVGPSTGANTVALSWTTAAVSEAAAISYIDVNQASPLGTNEKATFAGVQITTDDVTSAAGELVIDFLGKTFDENCTAGAGQTERADQGAAGTNRNVASSEEAGAGTVTMSWTWGTNSDGGLISVPMKPVPAFIPRTSGIF